MTKCNKTNKLKQCHKYKGSDREACISYNKYQTVNPTNICIYGFILVRLHLITGIIRH